jgi:8-oxo-dGTP pyrophosphatase MutT (NUDIX family)
MIVRAGARALLIDSVGRLLLIHERVGDQAQYQHWLTPGGGVEAGEDLATAAVREVFEETGLKVSLPPGAEPVHVRRRSWSWQDLTFDQTDHYFPIRVAAGVSIEPAALTDLETSLYLGFRWWTLTELRETSETIEPPQVADWLSDLLDEHHAQGGGDDLDASAGRPSRGSVNEQ